MPFGEGDLILIPPRIPHCWYFSSDDTDEMGRISNVAINFGNETFDRIALAFAELSEPLAKVKSITNAISISGEKAVEIAGIMMGMRLQSPQMRAGGFLNLLVLLGNLRSSEDVGSRKTVSKTEMKLNQVRTFVICNADRQITLADVAKHLGMSRSAFCVFFKNASGQTFVSYLNETRLSRAKDLLLSTSLSVAEISYTVGFNDVPYFHRIFKNRFGMSPQMIRKGEITKR